VDFLLTATVPIVVMAYFGGLFWIASRERFLRRRRLLQLSSAYRLLDDLTPDEMEDLAAELFRMRGYVVTENRRPDLFDGGVDFELAKDRKTWLVQVKHWRNEVSVKEARELWGIVASESAAGAKLIGTSGFSPGAREFAEGKDFQLIDGNEFMKMTKEQFHGTAGTPASIEQPPNDGVLSQEFSRRLAGLPRPACRLCGKPMVLVTGLRDGSIAHQFWGCSSYPKCDGTRRFVFPYAPLSAEPGHR
jgi:restriction system protein